MLKRMGLKTYFQEARSDYDQTVKVAKQKIKCYTKDMMDSMYSGGEEAYTILGEFKKKNRKEETGYFQINDKDFIVSKIDSNSKILYKKVGYVAVSDRDEYLVLLKHRIPFIIWFWGLLLANCFAIWLIWFLLTHNVGKAYVLDNRLPDIDPNARSIEKEGDKKLSESVESDGSKNLVNMYYDLNASLDLATGDIQIYFLNPSVSNKSVTLQMFLFDDEGNPIPITETSGLVESGKGLEHLTFNRLVSLSAGSYTAKICVYPYNPETGERDKIALQIDDVKLSVS